MAYLRAYFGEMLDALTQTTSHLHAMIMHHIVAYAFLFIVDTVPSR